MQPMKFILAALAALVLAGCGVPEIPAANAPGATEDAQQQSASAEKAASRVAGEWRYAYVVEKKTAAGMVRERHPVLSIVFAEDGTVAVEPINDAEGFSADEGTYTENGSSIHIVLGTGEFDGSVAGTKITLPGAAFGVDGEVELYRY